MDPNLAISVTLTAGQWQGVLSLLAEAPAPWKLTDPLMRAIQAQCIAQDPDQPQPGTLGQLISQAQQEVSGNVVPLPQAGE